MNIPPEHKFYVVQYTPPHLREPDVVFVPNSWIRSKNEEGSICFSYPMEQRSATEGRILTGEMYHEHWKIYIGKTKGGFDTIDEAKHYMANIASMSQPTYTQRVHFSEECGDETDDDDEDQINRIRKLLYSSKRKLVRDKKYLHRGPLVDLAGGPLINPMSPYPVPQVGHPPKRKLSVPSTSSQLSPAKIEAPNSYDKKMRLRRDLKHLSRGFSSAIDQVDDMLTVMNRLRTSLKDMQSVSSSLVSTVSDILDIGDDMPQNIESKHGHMATSSTSTCFTVPMQCAVPKVDIPHTHTSFARSARDSKWTLRYREKEPGVVELMANTGVYLSEYGLQKALDSATDSKTLARTLMKEIFSDYALSVCSLAGGKSGISDRVRPGLDSNARAVLMIFVTQYSKDKKWDMSEHSILMSLRNKLLEMRRHSNLNH